jgi:hypothetical protein
MEMLYLLLGAVIVYLLYQYRSAKVKKEELRNQVRDAYLSIQNSVFNWSKDKGEANLIAEAIQAVNNYNQARKWASITPLSFSSVNAEQFEYLQEWKIIFQKEDSALHVYRDYDESEDEMLKVDFYSNMAEVRELEQSQYQYQTEIIESLKKSVIEDANYFPYISPERVIARQASRDKFDERHPDITSDTLQDMSGFWGDDSGYCKFLRKARKEKLN